jgi:hypothetical protein
MIRHFNAGGDQFGDGRNKNGRACLPLPFLVENRCLEFDAQAHLNPSRPLNAVGGDQLSVDNAKSAWVCRVQRRIEEVNVVEEIEEVRRKLEFYSLRDGRGLSEAHVQVPKTQTWERAAPAIVGVSGQQSRTEIRNCSRGV